MSSCLDRPVQYRPMTKDEVLRVLIELRRIEILEEEADPEVTLTFATTIKEWTSSQSDDYLDLWPQHEGDVLNYLFETDFTHEDWAPVLFPRKKRTLGDVCRLLSTRARVPIALPVHLLGRPCEEAGTFLTLRGILAADGYDVSVLSPTARLPDDCLPAFNRSYKKLILRWPSLLRISRPIYPSDSFHLMGAIFLLFASTASALLAFGSNVLFGIPACLLFGGFVWVWRDSVRRRQAPVRILWHGVQTFRELCLALVNPSTRDDATLHVP